MVKKKNIHYQKYKDTTECAKCGRSIKNLHKSRKYCNRCKNTRCIHGKYKCRIIVTGRGKKDVYGITIPKEIVDNNNLKNKVFSIRTTPKGKFILYTMIKK